MIIGQDPYHGPNQAHGMCFSVRVGVRIPPSLQNMYKELSTDIEGFKIPTHGYLMGWAKQGVLLLNACLTVRQKEPNSHAGKVSNPSGSTYSLLCIEIKNFLFVGLGETY